MSAPKQWDISKAVVIASFFNFFHNVGNFCIFPFLTIFFRHLGLSPPLVGILMGAQHLVVALWAPFCTLAAKTDRKRRMVITSSLLLSAMAGALLTVYPPLSQELVTKFCNASLPGTDGHTTPSAMDFVMFAPEDNDTSLLPNPPLMTTMASTQFTTLATKPLVENPTLGSSRDMDTDTKFGPTTHSDASSTLRKITKMKDRMTTIGRSTSNLEPRTSAEEAPPIDPDGSTPQEGPFDLPEPKQKKAPVNPISPAQAENSDLSEPKESKSAFDNDGFADRSTPPDTPSRLLEPKGESTAPRGRDDSTESSAPPVEASKLLEPKEKSSSTPDRLSEPKESKDKSSAQPSNLSKPRKKKPPVDHNGSSKSSTPSADSSHLSEPKDDFDHNDSTGSPASPVEASRLLEPNENLSSVDSSPPENASSHSEPKKAPLDGDVSAPPDESSKIFEPKKRDVRSMDSQALKFLEVEIKTFLVVLGIIVLWGIFASPLEWTANDSLHEYLDFVDATDRHDKVWIWRYLGACLGSCFIVILIDGLKCYIIPQIPKIYLHFYGYTTFMVVTLLFSISYPVYVSKNKEHANKTVKALSLMGSDWRIVLLFVTLFLMGAVKSTAENFLFWQMQDLGSSEFYMGLSVAVALLSEIFLYMFKNRLMKSLTFKWMVVVALLCQAAQLLYFSFLWAPWAVLPVQVLSAFSNGALIWAVKSQVDDIANPGTERSIQLILNCLSHHSGASLGSFASGFVISSFGLPVLYWACCLVLLLWILMFLIIQPKMPQSKKINYSRLLAPDNSDMSDSEDEQEQDWLVKAMKDDRKIW